MKMLYQHPKIAWIRPETPNISELYNVSGFHKLYHKTVNCSIIVLYI